jgi:cation diffusion facilitator CzcD-associated flavoprotein CzcO
MADLQETLAGNAELTADKITSQWLDAFAEAAGDSDGGDIDRLFAADAWWRDLLALSWDFRTLHGREQIRAFLGGRGDQFRITQSAVAHSPEPQRIEREPGSEYIESFITFETVHGTGRGIVRLVADDDGVWRAWTLLLALQNLQGHPQARGATRPVRLPISAEARPGETWRSWRQRKSEFVDEEPAVLVLGSGHGGLMVAANLGMFGVPTLVIEKNPRVGDNWRNRYSSLVLHDPVWLDHLPGMPFPETWPVHTPKDKLGDWLEMYASAMELNVWTSTEVVGAAYDDDARQWAVSVRRADGAVRTVHPNHIVLATGVHGEPNIPEIPGRNDFRGQVVHSGAYTGAGTRTGMKAVVIGAGNSGHDIAEHLCASGADVTLVQRSSTYVMSQKSALSTLYEPLYHEGGPALADADLLLASFPYRLALQRSVRQTEIIAELDRELLDGLVSAGFHLDMGIGGAGAISKTLSGGGPGGYYMDVGCSQLIIDGKIKMTHAGVERFTTAGVAFDDGSELAADTVVLATGYKSMRETARRILGADSADRCGPVWGLNDEGELQGMWRNSGHPGLWFMGGSVYIARFYSHYLSLQIHAIEQKVAQHPVDPVRFSEAAS